MDFKQILYVDVKQILCVDVNKFLKILTFLRYKTLEEKKYTCRQKIVFLKTVSLLCVSVRIMWHYTALPLVLDFWSRDTDVSIILSIISVTKGKLLKSNNYRSKPEFFRLLWKIVVFRLRICWIWSVVNLECNFYIQFLV